MNPEEIESIFEQTARDLGFDSFLNFAKSKMIQTLKEKLELSASVTNKYEKKYSMKLIEFQSKFNELNGFTIIEKEDDEMDWEWHESSLEFLSKRLEEFKENNLDKITTHSKSAEKYIIDYYNELKQHK